MTLNELEKLCSNLNSAIGSYHLRLLKIDPGCVQLTFRALPSADEMIQKLTREEQQDLRKMGVISITYGEQTVSLSGKIAEHEDDEEAAKDSESDFTIEVTESEDENSDSSDTNPPFPIISPMVTRMSMAGTSVATPSIDDLRHFRACSRSLSSTSDLFWTNSSYKSKVCIFAVTVTGIAACIVAPYLAPYLLPIIGFTTEGVAPGSIAEKIQTMQSMINNVVLSSLLLVFTLRRMGASAKFLFILIFVLIGLSYFDMW